MSPRTCVLLAAILAGCAAPPPGPSMAAGPGPAPIRAGFDGTYRPPPGGIAGSVGCASTLDHHTLRVRDGVATLRSTSRGEMTGPVGPDGTINIEAGRAFLRGQITGDVFTGTLVFGRCGYQVVYHRV